MLFRGGMRVGGALRQCNLSGVRMQAAGSARNCNRGGSHQPSRRMMSSNAPAEPSTRQRTNYIIAGSLLSFVGGVYYTAINKMKQEDDLAKVLAEEAPPQK